MKTRASIRTDAPTLAGRSPRGWSALLVLLTFAAISQGSTCTPPRQVEPYDAPPTPVQCQLANLNEHSCLQESECCGDQGWHCVGASSGTQQIKGVCRRTTNCSVQPGQPRGAGQCCNPSSVYEPTTGLCCLPEHATAGTSTGGNPCCSGLAVDSRTGRCERCRFQQSAQVASECCSNQVFFANASGQGGMCNDCRMLGTGCSAVSECCGGKDSSSCTTGQQGVSVCQLCLHANTACTSDAQCCGGGQCATLLDATGGTSQRCCAPGRGHCIAASSSSCETDLTDDVNNCGGCGHTCPGANTGAAACVNGQCRCNANTSNDVRNCGACGHACAAGETCEGGTCVEPCPAGQARCNGVCTDVLHDGNNCGGCGFRCEVSMGTGTSCIGGVCQCPGGQRVCGGGTSGPRRCVDYLSDNTACGSSCQPCADGTGCQSGLCVSTCSRSEGSACNDPSGPGSQPCCSGLTCANTAVGFQCLRVVPDSGAPLPPCSSCSSGDRCQGIGSATQACLANNTCPELSGNQCGLSDGGLGGVVRGPCEACTVGSDRCMLTGGSAPMACVGGHCPNSDGFPCLDAGH